MAQYNDPISLCLPEAAQGDMEQLKEDNQTIIERISSQITDLKTEQEAMKKETDDLVKHTLDRKLLNLQEELSGRNEDNWMKSLKLAQETMKTEDEQPRGPPKDKLVAMNNKIYKLANEEDSEPKPRLQVKK